MLQGGVAQGGIHADLYAISSAIRATIMTLVFHHKIHNDIKSMVSATLLKQNL